MADGDDTAEPSTVSWRDYMRVCIARETGIILAKLEAINERNTTQVGEIARRLEALNHAHAKAVEDRHMFVNKDVFEQTQVEHRRFRDTVTQTLGEQKGRDMMVVAIASTIAAIVVGLVLLVGARL